jgi:Cys-rich repeat protein
MRTPHLRLRSLSLACGAFLPLLALLALLASLGCVGTPLPDPPSARADLMMISDEPPTDVRLVGTDGAIVLDEAHEAGGTLRVSVPRTDARSEGAVAMSGTFDVTLEGASTDTLYLELLDPERDIFLAAVAQVDGVVVAVDDGGDRDGDLSPDSIDCAPDDPALASRECPTCATDADCGAGQICTAGVCAVCPGGGVELCRNGLDDDCDGAIDEFDDCI